MSMNIPLEAAYLRAALLVGLAHERDIPAWADSHIADGGEWTTRLADVTLAPVELSAMRDALYPIAKDADPGAVLQKVFQGFRDLDPLPKAADLIRRLTLLRPEFKLAQDVDAVIKGFAGKAMLVQGNVPGAVMPTLAEIAAWLVVVAAQKPETLVRVPAVQ